MMIQGFLYNIWKLGPRKPIPLRGLVTCYDRPNIWQDARKYTECTGWDVLELRWMS